MHQTTTKTPGIKKCTFNPGNSGGPHSCTASSFSPSTISTSPARVSTSPATISTSPSTTTSLVSLSIVFTLSASPAPTSLISCESSHMALKNWVLKEPLGARKSAMRSMAMCARTAWKKASMRLSRLRPRVLKSLRSINSRRPLSLENRPLPRTTDRFVPSISQLVAPSGAGSLSARGFWALRAYMATGRKPPFSMSAHTCTRRSHTKILPFLLGTVPLWYRVVRPAPPKPWLDQLELAMRLCTM
mmetsp:Transcript_16149/g.35774  ORF Transcript_16149/g.35774 Transcript_16149/m.35774 type:complete len:245 (-) Transcript_16149:1339-2073(-)